MDKVGLEMVGGLTQCHLRKYQGWFSLSIDSRNIVADIAVQADGFTFRVEVLTVVTAKTTGKTHGLPIGSGQGGRDTVHPADQHPVLIQAA